MTFCQNLRHYFWGHFQSEMPYKHEFDSQRLRSYGPLLKMIWTRPKSLRFEVLTASSMKTTVFCDVALCNLAGVDRRFRCAYCVHHQGVGLLQRDYKALYPRRLSSWHTTLLQMYFQCDGTPDTSVYTWSSSFLTDRSVTVIGETVHSSHRTSLQLMWETWCKNAKYTEEMNYIAGFPMLQDAWMTPIFK
jgi:hypothetical protein